MRPSGSAVNGSVRPSVRLSVTLFSLCTHHHIVMKLSGVITIDRSDVHAKGQGQRSQMKTPFSCFQTITLVWILWWLWNDAQNLKQHRRGALLRSPIKFQSCTGGKIYHLNPICVRLLGRSQLSNPSNLPWFPSYRFKWLFDTIIDTWLPLFNSLQDI